MRLREVGARLAQIGALVFALSFALFGVLSFLPGDPIDLLILSNPNIKPDDVAALKELRGLDKPWPVRWWRWLAGHDAPRSPPRAPAVTPVVLEMPADGKAQVSFDLPALNGLAIAFPRFVHVERGRASFVVDAPGVYPVPFAVRDVHGLEDAGVVEILVAPTMTRTPDDAPRPLELGTPEERQLGGSTESAVGTGRAAPLELARAARAVRGAPSVLPLHNAVADETGAFRVEGVCSTCSLDLDATPFAPTDKGRTVRFGLARVDDRTTRPFAVVVDHGAVIDPERRERGAWAVLVGDTDALGYSQTYRRPVWELLFGERPSTVNRGVRADGSISLAWRISHFGRVQNTALLMGPAMLLAALLAILLGALAAAAPRGKVDRLVGALAIAGVSLPSFWIGIMGVVVFAGLLGWLPAGGAQTPGLPDDLGAVLADRARHAVLPTLVLALVYAGQWLRYVRAGVLETVSLEFVRTARAKGASRARVLAHALRAALLPFVTVVALSVPAVFSGAALTEIVFSWPGVGRLQYDAIQHNDSYVAIVVFLVSATLVMLGSLGADLLYGVLDPRLRRRGAR